ncbi:NAD(P)-dependent alcohol dehydrogenase [Microbacterium terricola]|uniref:NADPH:quinone reductase n=1 Tax=Microbacterium terricola TaxID=344163 RepID=A0ABM8E2S8_9MICO|nr:NAD(P)-dependent alcohol dehydrogenase [Microbacterium terricola]UYK40233.1 NAD(P)-dependent alcohol dehydrogenase [Microbacterium terricola]BDV32060.1 NADPH:quinone reductase [Microbacterium terricola]
MSADAVTTTMWIQRRYGGPEAVVRTDAPAPVAGRGEVLLRVRATALNSADVRVMRGDPLILRLAFGLRRPRTPVQGRDVAGTVVEVGDGVDGLAVGDEVVGELSGGGLAELVVAPAARLVRRPVSVDAVDASSVPMAGGTAWQALAAAGIGADAGGRRILVVGAGGGVGTFAVRLAAIRGATVTALAGERALDVVRRLGAAEALDYRQTPLEALATASFDAVVMIAGDHPLRALRRLVAPGGTVVLVSGGSHRVFGPLGAIARAGILSIGASRRLRPLAATAKPEVTAELLALVASGELRPHIEQVYPLSDARAALAHVDAGHTVGKVVVTP